MTRLGLTGLRIWLIALVMCILGPGSALAERQSHATYVFGNSLVYHVDDARPRSNVPHWLDAMAESDGRRLALDGQWGFLRNFANQPVPTANWSFPGVDGHWSPDEGAFADAGWDSVVITPANFIQYQAPDARYDGPADGPETPLDAILQVTDRSAAGAGGAAGPPVLIYEGWADMATVVGRFPPNERRFERYHRFNLGAYHDWYVTLIDELRAARPDRSFGLIPVSSILAELFSRGGPLADLPPLALYTDDAPHGTPTLYLLAAMVTYSVLFDAPPPHGYVPPEEIETAVRDAWPALAARIWEEVQASDLVVAVPPSARDRAAADPSATPDMPPRARSGAATATLRSGSVQGPATVGLPRGSEGAANRSLVEAAPSEMAAAPSGRMATEAAERSDARPSVSAPAGSAETEVAGDTGATASAESSADPAGPDAARASSDGTDADPTPFLDAAGRALPAGKAPALAMGLNGLSDWSTQHPFLDLMKSARPWVAHTDKGWGAIGTEELQAGGHLDADGWPISQPDGARAIATVILTDQPEEARHLRGRYVLSYTGSGTIRLGGRATSVRYEPGRITFDYSPGEGLVEIALSDIPATSPISDITIIREDHLRLAEAGVLFNPLWIDRIADLRVIRLMDWMMTNGSRIESWHDRPRVSDAMWTRRGVPLEVMLRLANVIGADPWFTLPHRADDDYVRRFADAVRDGLDPDLKAWVEYSNEVWNFIFPQARWAADQSEARWGASETGWMQYYGLRAAEVADIWTQSFGAAARARLIRVVAVQTGWPGLEESVLLAPLAYMERGRAPSESFDVYAVTGYFGSELGSEEMARDVDGWLDAAEATARARGEAEGLRRVALREYVRRAGYDAVFTRAAETLRHGSLATLLQDYLPYHAGRAARAGLTMVMYEGGTHVVGSGPRVNDDRLTAFLTAFNYSRQMAELYDRLLVGWLRAGGTLFNAYVDVAPATQWGSWGARRHLEDDTLRWDALMAYNVLATTPWDNRAAEVFAHGLTRVAESGNQRLMGTREADILIGGPGDDTLIASGGDDILHGGDGTDRAILPGAQADYVFERDGPRLLARSSDGLVRLAGIETLVFEAAPAETAPADAF